MKYDVITFGSATLDMYATIKEEHITSVCDENGCLKAQYFTAGEKILLNTFDTGIGGGGTNTALCFAKLGLRVAYGGAIGKDNSGDSICTFLKHHNIDFVGSQIDARTNTSIILDSHVLHDRTILAYKDASDKLELEHVQLENTQTTWMYFSSLLEKSYETMLKLMRYAQENNIAIAFNPSSYQTKQGLHAIQEAITLSQVLTLNKEEAECLVGEGNSQELCIRLRSAGAEIVLITNGEKGASLLYGDVVYEGKPIQGKEVVETTGAGDCFSSTFLAGLIHGLSPKESLKLAFIQVEALITQIGAKNGILPKDEAFLQLQRDTRHISDQKL